MSKDRIKPAHKGPGYRPKTAGQPKKKNNVWLIVAGVAILAAIALIAQPLLFPSKGREVTTPSGLKYIDQVVGTGASPSPGKQVSVHYTGTLENGTKFDSSVDRGQPITFPIGARQVIQGWDEGIMSMKVGGKRRLIIPGKLGYGPEGRPPTIPPNATLLFDVELVDVK